MTEFPKHDRPFTKTGLTADGRLVAEGQSSDKYWIGAPEQFRTVNPDIVRIAVYDGTGRLHSVFDATRR